jgi:aminoglycoside 3-N-acetyltransferase I
MTREPTISLLKPGETAALEALLSVFAEAFDDSQSYADSRPSQAYLEGLLARETFLVVVARVAEDIVGGLTAYVLDKFEQERREIYIYDLGVRAAHRRRGIATALIRKLQDVASERGACVIFVQADLDDGPSIALYRTFGDGAALLQFDIAVAGFGSSSND